MIWKIGRGSSVEMTTEINHAEVSQDGGQAKIESTFKWQL